MKRFLCLTMLFCFAATLWADDGAPEIYRSKDKYGNTVFADRPSDNAEQVELQETNRAPAVTPQPRPKKDDSKESAGYVATIVQPENNSVIPNGLVPTQVSVNINPPLLPKHRIEFLMDGASLAVDSSHHYTINRLTPGSHQITARVVDVDGEPLGEADTVKVTAYWPGNR